MSWKLPKLKGRIGTKINKQPLVEDNMADWEGEGNKPPRRTLGNYAYQQGPKHYNNIVIPPFCNKFVEFQPTLLSLIGSHPFAGMDHEDPCTHLSTFMELCSTMGAFDEDAEAVYLRAFPFSLAGKAKTREGQNLLCVKNRILNKFYSLNR